ATQAVFSYFRVILFVNVTEHTLADLRRNLYSHLVRLHMNFFSMRRIGELTSRISSDITMLQDTLTTTLAEFLRQIITIIGGIILVTCISYKLTLVMLCVIP